MIALEYRADLDRDGAGMAFWTVPDWEDVTFIAPDCDEVRRRIAFTLAPASQPEADDSNT